MKLNPEQVYSTILTNLTKTDKYRNKENFISRVVQALTITLVNDDKLSDMRKILRNLKYQKDPTMEHKNLFKLMYTTFCYNKISTITLCLLSEEYELTYNLLKILSEEELDVNSL
jgi:vacuole morphology and inheritance protein 14